MKELLKSRADIGCLAAIAIGLLVLIICSLSGFGSIVTNAIVSEFNRPRSQAVTVEQQTVNGALVDTNGDTAAKLTGYEMTFPKGVIDWRVIYAGRPSTEYLSDSRYTIIEPTYWCLFEDGRWLSCQPVISEVQAS